MTTRTSALGGGGPGDALRVHIQRIGAACVVLAVEGELDVAAEPELATLVRSATELPGVRAVALDLGGCTFCDVRGLAGIVTAAAAARRAGLDFGLLGVPAHVQRLATLAGLNGRFPREVAVSDLLAWG